MNQNETVVGAELAPSDADFADLVPRTFVCARCREPFLSKSQRRYYCPECAKIDVQQWLDSERKGAKGK